MFVDAGYLLAEGGRLCLGTRVRSEIYCDGKKFLAKLVPYVHKHSSPSTLLRIYWYDGAQNQLPTNEQMDIAKLPNVKLRLGRLSGNRQKGVDSLILRDLIILSQRRAINTAHIITGDEDIREGIVVAQEYGVRVVLVGIEGDNQASSLKQEADICEGLSANFLADIFELRKGLPDHDTLPTLAQVVEEGRIYAREWKHKATSEEIDALIQLCPKIPKQLDYELIVAAEKRLHCSLIDKTDLRHVLRQSFWEEIKGKMRWNTI